MIAYTEYKLRAYDKEDNLVCSTGKERYEAKIEALAKDVIEDIVVELPDYEEGSYKGEEEDVWDD